MEKEQPDNQNETQDNEFIERMKKLAMPGEPYRLELLYNDAKKMVTLQADERGFKILLDIISSLAKPDVWSGRHAHLDEVTFLTKSEIRLIIQRVSSEISE
jgi:hypothetical protein